MSSIHFLCESTRCVICLHYQVSKLKASGSRQRYKALRWSKRRRGCAIGEDDILGREEKWRYEGGLQLQERTVKGGCPYGGGDRLDEKHWPLESWEGS